MENRIKKFETVLNVRDFGGYETVDGGKVKANKLFRSAHLHNTNDADKARLQDLDIGLIVDLRHKPERERQPTNLAETHTPRRLAYPDPEHGKSAKIAPHEAFMQHDLHTPEDARNYMIGSYGQRPHDAGFKQIFGDTLRHMAETGDPILVHCAAGKDRTGTLCALIQGVLGVSRADILADYMMTLESVDIDKIIGPAAEMFSKRYGRPIDAEALWPMFGVKPEFLDAALDGMGDMEEYVTQVLGVSETAVSKIRQAYLHEA